MAQSVVCRHCRRGASTLPEKRSVVHGQRHADLRRFAHSLSFVCVLHRDHLFPDHFSVHPSPDEVHVVMRYAAFHDGSDIAVRILETARLQNVFEPVLEALLAAQPQWADHSGARLDIAWAAAAEAGLDVDKARAEMNKDAINDVLTQDALDVETVGVHQTPTFFVDGRPLLEFGAKQLIEMVRLQVESQG